jgi:hypothetical protein
MITRSTSNFSLVQNPIITNHQQKQTVDHQLHIKFLPCTEPNNRSPARHQIPPLYRTHQSITCWESNPPILREPTSHYRRYGRSRVYLLTCLLDMETGTCCYQCAHPVQDIINGFSLHLVRPEHNRCFIRAPT